MSEKRWLQFIFGLYFLLAVAYSWLMPPWEGPDEPAHYILVVNLARGGGFSSLERNYEAGQPQTYYLLASVPLRFLNWVNPDWVAVIRPPSNFDNVRQPAPIYTWSEDNYLFLPGVYLLRWVNILIGASALLLNYRAMRNFVSGKQNSENEKDDRNIIPLSALALIALPPQFLHTTSTVNNDALGILAGAFLFWATSKIFLGEVGAWGLGGILVAAFLLPYGTKLTVFPVGLGAAIGVVNLARKRWPERWKWFVGSGISLGMGVILLVSLLLPEMSVIFLRQIRFRVFEISPDALNTKYLWNMISQVVWSFWGKVGWLAVGLPGWVVIGLTGLGMVGVVMEGIRGREKMKLSGLVWLVAGMAILAVLKNGLSTVNSQGRFLFPAAGALGVLMVSGWGRATRLRPFLLGSVIALMLGTNLILWFGGIIPVYFQPLLH